MFDEHSINYTVIGGVAMAFHDEPRFTKDIDILILPEEYEKIKTILKQIDYFESSPPWTFKTSNLTLYRFMKVEDDNYLVIDILASDAEKYRSILNRSIIDTWKEGSVRIIKKEDLIWMKKQRNSDQDKVDIKKLK